jgi:hypothetical protein
MEVSFKKKSKRSAASKKRARRAQEDAKEAAALDAGVEDVDDVQRSIAELREDQRLRDQLLRAELARHKPETLNKQKKKADAPADPTHYGLHDPKKDGSTNQKLLTLLDGQFTGQSGTTDKDQHEELMNQFIEERLQKKRKTGTPQVVVDEKDSLKTAEDKLFELPEHLKPDVPSLNKGYDDGTEGGMLMGSAGIAEVELPSTYAEKTEHATRRAIEASKSGAAKRDAVGGLANSALPANFSTDFNRHRTDYVAEMKSMNKGAGREGVVAVGLETDECCGWTADEQRERGFRTGWLHVLGSQCSWAS